MAALATTNPTLLDLIKATDPDGTIATVVELLNQSNQILDVMSWQEGNLPTGHKSTIRSGLPAPVFRKLYQGVQPTKSTTVQVTDNCGMLEDYAEVDKALADLNGNSAAWMLTQHRAHLEGFNQKVATSLFYSDEGTTPEAFTGLAPRFNSTTAANGENVIVGGGASTDNQSIWLVYWHPTTVFGIIPKGSKAGLQVTDKGQVTVENAGNDTNFSGRMEAYRTHYRWDVGLCVADWRAIVRIPNIAKSTLTKTGSTGADLADLMFQAMEQIPTGIQALGRPAFFMSRSVMSYLRRQLVNKTSGSTLSFMDVGGKKVMDFQGIPLMRVDVLSADEALVS